LLSENAALQKLGLTLAFSMNRLGLAASQTLNYTDCMISLNDFLDQVPSASGFLPTGVTGAPDIIATVNQKPSKDGTRTLCSTIVALSGKETVPTAHTTPFQGYLLHQGSINVWVAIAETAVNAPLPQPSPIRLKLCQALRVAWTLTDGTTVYNLVNVGDSQDPVVEFNGCVTRSTMSEPECLIGQDPPQSPDWLPIRRPDWLPVRGPDWLPVIRPEVEAGHDFDVKDVLALVDLCRMLPCTAEARARHWID
jgi:hypothetical protein